MGGQILHSRLAGSSPEQRQSRRAHPVHLASASEMPQATHVGTGLSGPVDAGCASRICLTVGGCSDSAALAASLGGRMAGARAWTPGCSPFWWSGPLPPTPVLPRVAGAPCAASWWGCEALASSAVPGLFRCSWRCSHLAEHPSPRLVASRCFLIPQFKRSKLRYKMWPTSICWKLMRLFMLVYSRDSIQSHGDECQRRSC